MGALLLCFGESSGGYREELSDVGGRFPWFIGVQAKGGGGEHVPREAVVGVLGLVDLSETLCDALAKFVECPEGRSPVDGVDGSKERREGVDRILDHFVVFSKKRCATTLVTKLFVRRCWAEVALNQNY